VGVGECIRIAQIRGNGHLGDSLKGLGTFLIGGTTLGKVVTGKVLDPHSRPSLTRVSVTSMNSSRWVSSSSNLH
jgi:hypothetical protein